MNQLATRILLAGIVTLSVDQAFAHFKFLEPPSALVTENGGKGAPRAARAFRRALSRRRRAGIRSRSGCSNSSRIPDITGLLYRSTRAPRFRKTRTPK